MAHECQVIMKRSKSMGAGLGSDGRNRGDVFRRSINRQSQIDGGRASRAEAQNGGLGSSEPGLYGLHLIKGRRQRPDGKLALAVRQNDGLLSGVELTNRNDRIWNGDGCPGHVMTRAVVEE